MKVIQTMMKAELEQFSTQQPPAATVDDKDAIEVIECETLDTQHRQWLQTYLSYCQESLQQEIDRLIPDLTLVGYFRHELLKYRELLARI